MWEVTEQFSDSQLESLPKAGFHVSQTRGVARVVKHGCGAEFRQTAEGNYVMTIPPSIMLKGQFAKLWDAGYQKFLLTDEDRKYPALATQLVSLRRFNEELLQALGVPTYYNEAIGSTSQISAYDRIKGRPEGIPGEGTWH